PLQRLRAARALLDAGIEASVLMAPLVPGITTARHKVERTVKAIADHGIGSVGAMVMHLEGGTRDHFMRVLAREYPALVESYGRLYAAKHPPKAYTAQVQEMVGLLKARYGKSVLQ
ncbi:MAG: radical SAM protein, partial [Vicinamibacteria bacterium]